MSVLIPALTASAAIVASHLGSKKPPELSTVLKYAVVGAGVGLVLAPKLGPASSPVGGLNPGLTPVGLAGARALAPPASRARRRIAQLEAQGFEAKAVETPWGVVLLGRAVAGRTPQHLTPRPHLSRKQRTPWNP